VRVEATGVTVPRYQRIRPCPEIHRVRPVGKGKNAGYAMESGWREKKISERRG
jgi:hypothetical protein